MSSHAPLPVHAISQLAPDEHVTSEHAPSPVQLMAQSQPLGHVTLPQSSALVQSIVHVCVASSQLVQSEGQLEITQ